jgi:hypothetical protein
MAVFFRGGAGGLHPLGGNLRAGTPQNTAPKILGARAKFDFLRFPLTKFKKLKKLLNPLMHNITQNRLLYLSKLIGNRFPNLFLSVWKF